MDEATHSWNNVFEQINRKIRATTRPPSGDTVFALARNNCSVREPCGVCGHSHKDAENPAAVFSESGAVCWSCTTELAPALHWAARDLAALHWLGDLDGQDEQIVNQAYSRLTTPGEIDWDNPPNHAELLKLLDAVPVRARIDELRRMDAERAPVRLEEDSRRIIQDPQGMPSDDFGDARPF